MAPTPAIVLAQSKSSWPSQWPQNSFHASSLGLKSRGRKGHSDNCTAESGVNKTYFLQGGGQEGGDGGKHADTSIATHPLGHKRFLISSGYLTCQSLSTGQ